MKYYVYMYLDLANVPFYIGKGQDLRYQAYKHLTDLNNNNRLLKNKIRKVGTVNVRVQFLHKNITEEEAFQQERHWIKYYGRRDKGEGTLCNLTDGGEGSSGYRHSAKARRKISEAGKGHTVSEKTRQKLRGPRKPYGPLSEKTKQKISKALKGNPKLAYWKGKTPSEETRQKISRIRKGHRTPKDTKLKISEAKKGHKTSEKTRQKISEALKGREVSEETKRKMSEAQRGRKHSTKTKQKIGEANKGKMRSEEAKRKMSRVHKIRNIRNG